VAQTFSTELTGISSLPVVKPAIPAYGGRLRRYRATVQMTAQASGDTIVLAKIPAGQVFAFGFITATATLGGTATLAIGNATTSGLYRAAAIFTAVETPTTFGAGSAGLTVAMQSTTGFAAEETVLATIAAASLPGAGSFVVDIYTSQG
jgi:hypothetical protein